MSGKLATLMGVIHMPVHAGSAFWQLALHFPLVSVLFTLARLFKSLR